MMLIAHADDVTGCAA